MGDADRSALVNDELLAEHERTGRPVYRLYEPADVAVVMGAGRKAEEDVLLDRAAGDGVPVLRRRGGGGTVVLSPGQAVLAVATEVRSPFLNREYFRLINDWYRAALAALGVDPARVEDRGISDLAIGERKILGTSIYRRRLTLFYQGSLLVACDVGLFERYLSYPSRVPDYRRGRGHREFCTTLAREGCAVTAAQVIERLAQVVAERLPALA